MKEKALQLIDNLIEDDIDVFNLRFELEGSYKYKYEAVRKRLTRAFGSVRMAYEAYGLYEKTSTPAKYEFYRCFYINDEYRVEENEYEKKHLMDLYNVSEIEFKRLTQEITFDYKKDALDKFLFDNYPDGFKTHFVESSSYRHLESYCKTVYNCGISGLVKIYDISEIVLDRWGNSGTLLRSGYQFESLVSEALYLLRGEVVKCQQTIGNCRPDFIIDGKWADAKLSSWAVFCKNSQTIEKYMKHTDELEIIYALGKKPKTAPKGVTFTHISELYPAIKERDSTNLISRIERFISHHEQLNEKDAK